MNKMPRRLRFYRQGNTDVYLLAKTQRCRILAVSGEKWQELEWGNLGLECESSLAIFL